MSHLKHKKNNKKNTRFRFIPIAFIGLITLLGGIFIAVTESQQKQDNISYAAEDTTPTPSSSLLIPTATFTSYKNLRYSNASPRLLLDLYTPDHAGPFPLIIYVHGGSWSSGSKDTNCAAYSTAKMMYRGFAVACINYRLTNEAIYPAQIEDVKGAVRFLRANAAQYKLYDTKIGIWGASSGGHLAALAGTTDDITQYETGLNLSTSSSVQAVVDYFGPTDLVEFSKTSSQRQDIVGAKLLGCKITAPGCTEKAIAASPLSYVTADDAPFFILHGDKDRAVPLSQSQRLHDSLLAHNVRSELAIVQGMGHGGVQTSESSQIDAVSNFFDLLLR
ncbi:MAG: alpha/beta hydrolase [Candidatus Levybacteria bacterium]|nr:alpha/beta hydrolase [Candidatus Levybacteria bacterium]